MSVIITRLQFWVNVLNLTGIDLDTSGNLREFRQAKPEKTMSQTT